MADDLVQAIVRLINSSAISGFMVDAKQVITFWSDEAQRLTGYTGSEAIGKPCWEVFAGKDERGRRLCRQGCRALLQAEFDGRIRAFNMLASMRSGRQLWLNVVSLVIPSPRGQMAAILHILQDIHRFKQTEQLARQVVGAVAALQLPELRPQALQQESERSEIPSLVEGAAGPRERTPATECEVGDCEGACIAAERLRGLTPREKEVLKLLSQGDDTAAIARKLVISQITARNHIQHILAKLGVRNRLEAALAVIVPPH
ncbi:MAG: PAS domain S-box protein [Chloroflexi bacterium]|nr:PAS domain S-box protein [Chloroflexota bacterium]